MLADEAMYTQIYMRYGALEDTYDLPEPVYQLKGIQWVMSLMDELSKKKIPFRMVNDKFRWVENGVECLLELR